ncbi:MULTISPECIES: dihydroxyacetone kinase phosphoryl donor subunit DhaM [Megasphaera]|uniref:phosphoenolpyruvate--glycerone phosphotransferase n=1 Tax=Megasphaera vaginalis (ex Srinivasan et al. 2021) TaxID=1111454 RepID=U7UF19_9FIRM|nr:MULTISPECIES: dihydroxyacetone kinase phosphoryl donor subunit DhaM [Megasphaera]ERT58027.1 dihydroxyacetone kinase, phosphotransfer subunit [Megasphaera vaginalis (ex Srinivasan et al. 2021)]
MVGIVVISHSRKLAEGVVELAAAMADTVRIVAAGGLEDGSIGTSFARISQAVEEAYSDDGVVLIMDMGSAVMTAEMVMETMTDRRLLLLDCPVVEGAVFAAVEAAAGATLEEIADRIAEVREAKKLPD